MLVRFIAALATGLLVALAGCAGCEQVTIPPQDGNESRATAVVLSLDQERTGAVHCVQTRQGQWAGDCVDWYLIDATRPERIEVEMRLRDTPASEPAYPLALELWSADGNRSDRAVTDANERAVLAFEPEAPATQGQPRRYYVAVKTIDPMTRPQGYRLRAVQDAAAPNQAPKISVRGRGGSLPVGSSRRFRVSATDADGEAVKTEVRVGGRVVASGEGSVDYVFVGRKEGNYVVEVRATDGRDTAVHKVAVKVVPKGPRQPPPKPKPKPKYDTRRNIGILEVERSPSGGTVLIEFRGGDGAEKGQGGRLMSGGRKIADIQIIEVYAEGSRARLLGEPSEVITGATRAEIDVPK
jgi:hypothetical protein